MGDPRVTGLRGLELDVFDISESADFYARTWGLREVSRENGTVRMRGTGDEHHVVTLHENSRAGLRIVNFAADDKAQVDALHERAKGMGCDVMSSPRALDSAGGGYGFEVRSPEGIAARISSDVARHGDTIDDASKPSRVNHVVLNSVNMDDQLRFFYDLLGFKFSDNNGHMEFIRCSANHHSIALAKAKGACLNHVAFEMNDFVSLMEGVGRVRLNDYEIGWGVGRHAGPGRNIFTYFVDPNGFAVEYTTEVEQVDDSYVSHRGDYWQAMPLRPCSWAGAKTVPTPWMAEAMSGKTVEMRNASCDDVISEKMAG